jgi:xylulokinase
MGREASRAPAGCEGAIWLPYLTANARRNATPRASGTLFGLTARHTRGHALRAVMEGVAFGLRDSLEIIRALKIPIGEIRLTGGGARSPLWRQIQADVFGSEVTVLRATRGQPSARRFCGRGRGGVFLVRRGGAGAARSGRSGPPVEENVKLYDRLYVIYGI